MERVLAPALHALQAATRQTAVERQQLLDLRDSLSLRGVTSGAPSGRQPEGNEIVVDVGLVKSVETVELDRCYVLPVKNLVCTSLISVVRIMKGSLHMQGSSQQL